MNYVRVLIVLCVVGLLAAGCRTPQEPTPINPEALGMHSKTEPAPEEWKKLQQQAMVAFIDVFGRPLPDSFTLKEQAIGWFTDDGAMRQIRASAKMPREEFRSRMRGAGWRAVPIPSHFLAAMHLPSDVPKDYMRCYLGQIKGKPSYLLWSDYAEVVMLVVDR
ncbi:MAG: hypothetical protein JWR26_172 [Pedosphaera sp.]|nr:hypothetical protein [Pedosphaera sp.]